MMKKQVDAIFVKHFSALEDPRKEYQVWHNLLDILVIAVCGTICGANGWKGIEEYGVAKQDWLCSFLELPHGIPSHDTFGRVFARISPVRFQECFAAWVQEVFTVTDGQVIPIDGKTLRRSHNKKAGKKAIHMVSAWATKNSLVLAQVKTDEKSNEINAVPELLALLDIKGCIVTADAMSCQRKITKQIVDQGGDYAIAVKLNQEKLYNGLKKHFSEASGSCLTSSNYDYHETKERNHGRTEIRRCWVTNTFTDRKFKEKFAGLTTIAVVESERHLNEKITTECRYYISSLADVNAAKFLDVVRQHWSIENKVHWVLDIAFREDESRIREGHSAENMALLRHIALNLLKQEKSAKVGTETKRLKAGWDNNYLAKVLFG